MKQALIFTLRLVTIFVFAALVATVIGYLSLYVAVDLLRLEDIDLVIGNTTLISFGIIFGYRLNDLRRDYGKKKAVLSPELLLNKYRHKPKLHHTRQN